MKKESKVIAAILVLVLCMSSISYAGTTPDKQANTNDDLFVLLDKMNEDGEFQSFKTLDPATVKVQYDSDTTDVITKSIIDGSKVQYIIEEGDKTDVLVIDMVTGDRFLDGSKVIYSNDEFDSMESQTYQNTISDLSIMRAPTTHYAMSPFWNASRDDFSTLESTRYSNIYTDKIIADVTVGAILGILSGGTGFIAYWAGIANGTVVGTITALIDAYRFNQVGDAHRIFYRQTRWQWDDNSLNFQQWKNASHWLDNNRGNVLDDVEPAIVYETLVL